MQPADVDLAELACEVVARFSEQLERAGSNAEAVLVVRDRGPGILPSDKDRIFDRCVRGASGKSAGGFGLGLWITRQIVEVLGGSIELESELGRGASFTVRLPRARASE